MRRRMKLGCRTPKGRRIFKICRKCIKKFECSNMEAIRKDSRTPLRLFFRVAQTNSENISAPSTGPSHASTLLGKSPRVSLSGAQGNCIPSKFSSDLRATWKTSGPIHLRSYWRLLGCKFPTDYSGQVSY